MSKSLGLVLAVVVLACAGCGTSKDAKAPLDVCSHCAGNQQLTAKGTCDACGMAVDVCASCAGDQTLKADGTCSGCGGKIAVKA